jgi:hypothetical protein
LRPRFCSEITRNCSDFLRSQLELHGAKLIAAVDTGMDVWAGQWKSALVKGKSGEEFTALSGKARIHDCRVPLVQKRHLPCGNRDAEALEFEAAGRDELYELILRIAA